MAEISVGLAEAEVIRSLAELEAFGEIMNVPPPRLNDILAKARAKMELKTARPIGDPGEGPPPPLLNP